MKKIILSADSTCDLPSSLIKKYNVQIIPLYINLNGKEYKDSIDINPDYIFDYYNKNKVLPTTASPNLLDYIRHFEKWNSDEYVILHITLGSGISSTYQNAILAANEFENVNVIDSNALSSASSLLLLRASDLIKEGKNISEIVEILEREKDLLEISFVIDSLTYLREGGRLSALQAFGANLLSIKPSIEVKNEKHGQMEVGNKYRGKLPKVLRKYISDKLENRNDINTKRLFITHSGASKEILDLTVNAVKEYQDFEEIIINRAGCTITTHCGENTVGLMYFSK